MRRWLTIAIVAGTAVALAVTAGLFAAQRAERARQARLAAITTAEQFVAAWEAGDWEGLDRVVADPDGGAGAAHAQAWGTLQVAEAEVALTDVTFDAPGPSEALASYTVTLTLSGLGEWRYEGAVGLLPGEADWAVAWGPHALHPELDVGQRLDRVRAWPDRAALVDRNGAVLGDGPFAELAGSVGEATEEQLAELGVPYQAGDVAGQSGLQRSLESRLAGAPGGEVRIVSADGEVVTVLHAFAATEPEQVRTTLDPAAQEAGQAALAPVGDPASLVAVHVPTGEVRAVVNTPPGGFNRALSGRYPPGSTFKVVTTAALLEHGLDPTATVGCPGTTSIHGRSFRNAGFAVLGPISFREAFAESCNTAFVDEADQLPAGALAGIARRFGFGVGYDIGVPVASSRFPEPADPVEAVAAAIGQGRVEATPLHMASVAAAVARGRWESPRILADIEATESGEPLSARVHAQLEDLMRHAVADGTGTGAQVGGAPVAGKTGTAEFGSGTATHAWFIAYRGDVAVAVLVESGGFGGTVAAPAAGRFFSVLG